MSELTTRFIDDTYAEYYNTGKHELTQIYLKSEADKVIAEKDKEIAELRTKRCDQCQQEIFQRDTEIAQLQAMLEERNKQVGELKEKYNELAKLHDKAIQACCDADKVIAHHKYKRCLKMYHYCAIKALYELDLKGHDVEWKWYSKWMHKWFKLAEKFKESK